MFAQGKWLNCDKEQFHMSFHCCCAQAWQDNCPIIKQRGVSQRSRVNCEKNKNKPVLRGNDRLHERPRIAGFLIRAVRVGSWLVSRGLCLRTCGVRPPSQLEKEA